MNISKNPKPSPSPSPSLPHTLSPKTQPSHGQTDATAGRDQVREVVRVEAPRQSQRPAERSSKGRTGG